MNITECPHTQQDEYQFNGGTIYRCKECGSVTAMVEEQPDPADDGHADDVWLTRLAIAIVLGCALFAAVLVRCSGGG